eukprot:6073260-Amphidinium_carterae.2
MLCTTVDVDVLRASCLYTAKIATAFQQLARAREPAGWSHVTNAGSICNIVETWTWCGVLLESAQRPPIQKGLELAAWAHPKLQSLLPQGQAAALIRGHIGADPKQGVSLVDNQGHQMPPTTGPGDYQGQPQQARERGAAASSTYADKAKNAASSSGRDQIEPSIPERPPTADRMGSQGTGPGEEPKAGAGRAAAPPDRLPRRLSPPTQLRQNRVLRRNGSVRELIAGAARAGDLDRSTGTTLPLPKHTAVCCEAAPFRKMVALGKRAKRWVSTPCRPSVGSPRAT